MNVLAKLREETWVYLHKVIYSILSLHLFNIYLMFYRNIHNYSFYSSFYEGNMVPAFGAAVFDPSHKLHDIIGPVATPFGWHLIYILTRELPTQNFVKMEL